MAQYIATCPFCGDKKTFELPAEKLLLWQMGEKIQHVFPELSRDDRERLISGTCPKCWNKMFGDEE